MAKQQFDYRSDSDVIMPGFYESVLFNSDMEYEINQSNQLDCESEDMDYVKREVKDFKGYCNDVCKEITDGLLEPILTKDEEICDSVEFDSLSSPRYYNFTTDKLNLKLNIDLELLRDMILSNEDMKQGFDDYLKTCYSSRSGFCSFVANNIKDYFDKWEYLDVMIDYYILTFIYDTNFVVEAMEKCYETSYDDSLLEIADYKVREWMVPIE